MKILLIITLLIFTSHAAYSETKWLGEITEEICTDEQYMIRAKIASSCIMDEKVFRKFAWNVHDLLKMEFISGRSNVMEQTLDSFIMLTYLDDYTNYKTNTIKKFMNGNDEVKVIVKVCFEKPSMIISCKKKIKYVIKYQGFQPYQSIDRHKKSKYIKCSDATEQRHIKECTK